MNATEDIAGVIIELSRRVGTLERQAARRNTGGASLSEIVKAACARQGLTQTEAAAESGIKLQRLSRALNGRAVLSAVDLAALAETLQLDDMELAAAVRASAAR